MTNKNNRRAALICSAPVIFDFLISQQVFFQLLHGTEYMLRADLNELFACAEAPVDRRTLHTGIARGLEVDGAVTSPTFTIVNELYGKRDLFHFDMYRLGSADELFDLGWEDYLDRGGVCAVEWSENVPEAFDGSEIRVSIEKGSDNARKITIEGVSLC